MANKKIKPVSEPEQPVQEPATALEKLQAEAPVIGAGQTFNDKVQAELARLETVEAENLRLNKENQELTDRIAQYIEEIETLKTSKPDNDEIRRLTDENDKYLMKISELTFENAKLEAKLQEANAKNAALTSRPARPPAQAEYRNVYRNSASANGYSSWN